MEDTVEFEIDGVISLPQGTDLDEFTDRFLVWIESQSGSFGGGIGPMDED